MGQCGCSDIEPLFRFPGPEGVTYAIQVYPSCHDCSTPAGVDVYRFDDEWAEMWCGGVDEAPFMSYDQDEPTNAQLVIPVLEPAALVRALKAARAEEGEDFDIAEWDVRFVLPDAVHSTLEEWRRL